MLPWGRKGGGEDGIHVIALLQAQYDLANPYPVECVIGPEARGDLVQNEILRHPAKEIRARNIPDLAGLLLASHLGPTGVQAVVVERQPVAAGFDLAPTPVGPHGEVVAGATRPVQHIELRLAKVVTEGTGTTEGGDIEARGELEILRIDWVEGR